MTAARLPGIQLAGHGASSRARVATACLVATVVIGTILIGSLLQIAPWIMHIWLGSFTAVIGVAAFLMHGGGRITVLGLMNLAFALFVGFSGVMEGVSPEFDGSGWFITLAIGLACLGQTATTALAWGRADPGTKTRVSLAPLRDTNVLVGGAVALLVLLWLAQRVGLPLATSAYADGAASTGVVLLGVGLLFRRPDASLLATALPLLAAFAGYAAFFHQGTGRLRLVALACAVGLLVTARFPRRWIKWASIAALPFALAWLAQDRLSLQESLAAGSSAGRTGLESMLSPIRVFARVIEATATGEHAPALGMPFLSVPFSIIPSEWAASWAPEAIGYQLVALTAPASYGTGYSVASTAFGEWYYSFAWVGLLAIVPLLAWLVVVLDRSVRTSLEGLDTGRFGVLRVAFWAMLAGGIGDLAWSGIHTWVARAILRMPVLVAFVLLVKGPRIERGLQRARSSPARARR